MAGRGNAANDEGATQENVQERPGDSALTPAGKTLNVHGAARPVFYSVAAAAAIAAGGAAAASAAEVAPPSSSSDAAQSPTMTPLSSALTGAGQPAFGTTPVLFPEHLAPAPTAEKHTPLAKVRKATKKAPLAHATSPRHESEEAEEAEHGQEARPAQPEPSARATKSTSERHVAGKGLGSIRRSGANVETVRMAPGTTVWGVAEWVYGPSRASQGVAEIARASHLRDPGRIAAGQEIQVPLPAGEHAAPGVAEAHRVTLGSNLTELAGRAKLAEAEAMHAGNPNLIYTTQDWLKPANQPQARRQNLSSVRRQQPAAAPRATSPTHRVLVQQHIAALRTHAKSAGTFTGPAILTDADLAGWFHQHFGPGNGHLTHGVTVEKLATEYIAQGKAQGIRGDFAFVQACLESGGFTNRDTSLNNFAGIAHPQSASSGAGFADPKTGVAAQVQLLKKVAAGNNAPIAGPKVAPNWGGRNTNQVDGLAGNWASDPAYAQSLNNLWHAAIIWSLQHPDAGVPQGAPTPPPSPAAHRSRVETLAEAAKKAGYINPFGHGGWDWSYSQINSRGRLDQGFDPFPTHDTPILALGNGVVVESGEPGSSTGWPGANGGTGGFIAYRLTDGPLKGAIVYVAEHIDSLPAVGTVIHAGDHIGVAHAGYPNTEWGFASGVGTSPAVPGHPHNSSASPQLSAATSGGEAFVRFIEKGLGVAGLPDLGPGAVAPPGVTPTLPTVPVAPAPTPPATTPAPPVTPDAGPTATPPTTTSAPDSGPVATPPTVIPAPDPSTTATDPTATPPTTSTPDSGPVTTPPTVIPAPDPSPGATDPTTPPTSTPDSGPVATPPTVIPAPDPGPGSTNQTPTPPTATPTPDHGHGAPHKNVPPPATPAPDAGPVAAPPTATPAPDAGPVASAPTTIAPPDPSQVTSPAAATPDSNPAPSAPAPGGNSNGAPASGHKGTPPPLANSPNDVGQQGTLPGPASRVQGPASGLVQQNQSPQSATPPAQNSTPSQQNATPSQQGPAAGTANQNNSAPGIAP